MGCSKKDSPCEGRKAGKVCESRPGDLDQKTNSGREGRFHAIKFPIKLLR
jgi:hypothetical protein